MRTSVIIPTKDRPQELANAVASIVTQTHLPDELVIVDDGALEVAPLTAQLAGTPIELKYHQKTGSPGLTASRNIGVSLSSGDIVVFLDDDVVLEPGFIEGLLKVYAGDAAGVIGGVSGVITNERPSCAEMLYGCFCGAPLWGHGRVFASGVNQCNYSRVRGTTEVQWLGGGTSSYRRDVLERYKFNEGYKGYCLAEDLEFSFRVGQAYKLMITSDARMLHFQTLTDRVNRRELARQQMVNFWYHFHHNMPQRLGNKIAFGWLIVAMLLVDVANLVIQARRFPRMWARLIGHFGGLSHCLSQTKASNAKGKTEKTLDGAQ